MDRYDYLSNKVDQLNAIYNTIAEGKEISESMLEDIRVLCGETISSMVEEMQCIHFNEKHCPEPLELEEPLLYIALDDINSVPVVYYKGEEIKGKLSVSFDWKTISDQCDYPTYIKIEHMDEVGKKGLNTKTIQHNEPIDESKYHKLYTDGEVVELIKE